MLTLRIVSLTWNPRPLQAAIERAERVNLNRFGAFVRQRARSSLRKRKAISPPGSPPSSHTEEVKKFLFFAYDAEGHSVVIGPQLLSKGDPENLRRLEEGGDRTVKGRKTRRQHYSARPFMGPAFEAEKPNIPKIWENSIK